ncbi:MAG: FAD-dependent oxidoreductase [Gaiellaceae bacterium]
MACDPKYDVLFEPVQIGPKTMRNRFYQSAHCSGAGSEKPGLQAQLRAMKAEGGWAVVSTEYCSVAPDSDDFHRVGARLWDEGDVRNLAVMCDAVHEHGALAAVELVHGPGDVPAHETRTPPRNLTHVQSKFDHLRTPHAMTKRELRDTQLDFVRAARRARAAGFDVVTFYIAMANGLPHQLLMPLFNTRTDEYGGRFENRARYSIEALELLREAVGDDCAITVRYGLDTLPFPEGLGDQGLRAHGDGLRFIQHADHLVDLWDIQCGWAAEWGENAAPSRTHPENHESRYTADVKKHTAKPVMNVGRFTNPDTMVEVVRSGQCDIIGAARPSIADPFIPKKIEEGRFGEIRECIGCNMCIARWQIAGPAIICTQNATVGEEFRRGWHPERFSRAKNADNDVLVVGAGPAGMECAVVLGKRGMRRVHLVEAGPDVGGTMRWIPQLPGLGEWGRIVNYRRVQLDLLKNVEVIPNARLAADDVLDYGAELVVVSTGSHWVGDGLNGPTQAPIRGADASLPHVLTPEQVMVDGKPAGERVLVYDTDGYFMAVGMAEKLAREGHSVTYVAPFASMAPYTQQTLEAPRLNRGLRALGVEVVTEQILTGVEPGRATTLSVWDAREHDRDVDSVVLVTQRIPDDALFRELDEQPERLAEAGIAGLYQVGDCYAPGFIAEAIFSGHRLAREIDSPDPRTALPFVRERRLVDGGDEDYRLDGRQIYDIEEAAVQG